MVLICISQLTSDIEHLFTCSLAICESSVKCQIMASVHFLVELFHFFMVEFGSSFYALDINSLSYMSFANIFSQSVPCLFILFMVSFAVQKVLSFIRSHLFILFLFPFL